MARTQEPTVLADAAAEVLAQAADAAAGQGALDPSLENVNKVKFVGMAMDTVDEIGLHQEVTFLVRARCVAETVEELADGGVRQVRKMNVLNVAIKND